MPAPDCLCRPISLPSPARRLAGVVGFSLLWLAAITAGAAEPMPAPPAGSPVAVNGRLAMRGNDLVKAQPWIELFAVHARVRRLDGDLRGRSGAYHAPGMPRLP